MTTNKKIISADLIIPAFAPGEDLVEHLQDEDGNIGKALEEFEVRYGVTASIIEDVKDRFNALTDEDKSLVDFSFCSCGHHIGIQGPELFINNLVEEGIAELVDDRIQDEYEHSHDEDEEED